ncbi:hypothetical protein NIES267_72890 (plasmid) [Calothrix parasitica NIES-267]|uniref:Uncharacterized protein n=1 Tax=Calothrix parasitica NIES-267 TaxID=1973488 RepID=A0A1Z4M2T4_9CYAN|nr:hypothetical protein NIES267_72890 [Calothrix parasitica NIES-267]
MSNYNSITKIWDALSIAQSNPIVENQLLFSQFLEKQSEQTILGSVEIDSDEHGKYRVWRDSQFLGTFHRDKKNGLWISQPCNYQLKPFFESSNDAVMFVVEMNALVTAA